MIHPKIKQKKQKIKLAETEKNRAKQIELDVKFGYDRKLDETETCSTESTTTNRDDIFAEEGDMDMEVVEAKSPKMLKEADPKRVETEELEQQIKNQNYADHDDRSNLFMFLSTSTDYLNMVHFSIYYQQNGGFYSLLPYLLSIILFSFPVSIFEVSLAQFSSLSLFSLFHHLAPILSGIPTLIFIARLLYFSHVALRPKIFDFVYRLFYSGLSGDMDWMFCTKIDGTSCFDPSQKCAINEDQVFGKCTRSPDSQTIESYPELLRQQYSQIHFSKYSAFTGTQLFSLTTDMDTPSGLGSTFIYLVILGIGFIIGYKKISKISALLIILPIIGVLPVTYHVMKNGDFEIFELMETHNQFGKLFNWETWFLGFVEAFATAQVGKGTLLTFGSKVKFRHNFLKDMISATLFGVAYRLYYLMTLLPLYYSCQNLIYPHKTDPFDENAERNELVELLYYGLPILDSQYERQYFVLVALFFATIHLAIIAETMITFEIFKSCIYWIFPRLSFMNNKISVTIISIFFASLAMINELFSLEVSKTPSGDYDTLRNQYNWSRISCAYISCILTIYGVRFIYGDQRLYVNCLTMLHKHEKNLIGVPIIYGAIAIWLNYLEKRGNFGLLTSFHRWKPVNLVNENEASAAERMFGINI
ncbi:unnamed protein product [Caenorhabditis angaria]|uniref:Uncharacterized protein n=1 Tax=Caenorhabditis angaria TaxID=860376 RepID=A0A9P1INZ1_9PELO|nr:unnamed protein product [Caenorhabditis angaria]